MCETYVRVRNVVIVSRPSRNGYRLEVSRSVYPGEQGGSSVYVNLGLGTMGSPVVRALSLVATVFMLFGGGVHRVCAPPFGGKTRPDPMPRRGVKTFRS
jgi:hypothetical protein